MAIKFAARSPFQGLKEALVYAVDRDDDDDKSSGCTHPSTITNRGFISPIVQLSIVG
jgi:hypothetical protein